MFESDDDFSDQTFNGKGPKKPKAKKAAPPVISKAQGTSTGSNFKSAAAQRDSVPKPRGVIGTLKALRKQK